jgi:hypothetical protein
MNVIYANEETKLDPEQLRSSLNYANKSFSALFEFARVRKPQDPEAPISYSLEKCEEDFKNWVTSTRDLVKSIQEKNGKITGTIKALDIQYGNSIKTAQLCQNEVSSLDNELAQQKQSRGEGLKITAELITKGKTEAGVAKSPMPKIIQLLFKCLKNGEETALKDAPKKMTKDILQLISGYNSTFDYSNVNKLDEERKVLLNEIEPCRNNAKQSKAVPIYEVFMECIQSLIKEASNVLSRAEKYTIYNKVN